MVGSSTGQYFVVEKVGAGGYFSRPKSMVARPISLVSQRTDTSRLVLASGAASNTASIVAPVSTCCSPGLLL
jgi:hypothetical protein